MIIITHSKDLDGHSSGAICKRKYPDAKIIRWDYADEIPDFKQFKGEEVIMIDITFPIEKLIELSNIVKKLTVIDHHISFKREYDIRFPNWFSPFMYIYEENVAACEIGWKYLFPNEKIPYAITLLGRYDTWRQNEGVWDNETLPFQYAMRTICISPETFPINLLENNIFVTSKYDENLSQSIFFDGDYLAYNLLNEGKLIIKYQEQQDIIACERSAFEMEFAGLRALCLNARFFSSTTLKSIYDESKHDIMLGFEYTGKKWTCSLRSTKDNIDCSVIAKKRGGGGHAKAAGFETDSFENIFK